MTKRSTKLVNIFLILARFFDADLDKSSCLNSNNEISSDLGENEFFLRETGKNLKIIQEKIAKINENSYLSTVSSLNNNNSNPINTNKNFKSNDELKFLSNNDKLDTLMKVSLV
jgi:hypothetical protein